MLDTVPVLYSSLHYVPCSTVHHSMYGLQNSAALRIETKLRCDFQGSLAQQVLEGILVAVSFCMSLERGSESVLLNSSTLSIFQWHN